MPKSSFVAPLPVPRTAATAPAKSSQTAPPRQEVRMQQRPAELSGGPAPQKPEPAAVAPRRNPPLLPAAKDPRWPREQVVSAGGGMLGNAGRPLPPLDPQSVGTYFQHPVGQWPEERAQLAGSVFEHLLRLDEPQLAPEKRGQLQKEILTHWHALSEREQMQVMDKVTATVARAHVADENPMFEGKQARQLLEETFRWMDASRRDTLTTAAASTTRRAMAPALGASAGEATMPQHRNDHLIETLYDYAGFLHGNSAIGTLPPEVKNRKVAIVGAGAAGLCAAYELSKAGADVQLIEATDRVGGRLDARHFPTADGSPSSTLAEMGAMRFPPTGEPFFHYLREFGVETVPDFPNPGKVPTKMSFQGRVIDWKPGEPPDDPALRKVSADFDKMIGSAMAPMEAARKSGDVGQMRQEWQSIVDRFENKSFKQMVDELAKSNGIRWGQNELDAFGALGVGTGGFGPLYHLGAVQVLSVVLNRLEDDQQLIPGGTTAAIRNFATSPITRPDGSAQSLEEAGALRMNTQVMDVASKDGKPSLTLKGPDGNSSTEAFDAVIYTGSPRAAEHAKMTLHGADSDQLLSDAVETAIKQSHLVNSSKLFIEVDKQFWKNHPDIPQTIQTDQSLHGAYCLAYPGSDRGVVLLSYTWEDKSAKLQALSPEDRLALFKSQIEQISPEFAANLTPVNGKIHCIDWQAEKHQYGAFKLDQPSQSNLTNATNAQFQSALPDNKQPNSGVFVAGDGVSYHGGWVTGALTTGINAACATIEHLGGTLAPNSPLEQNTRMYKFDKPAPGASAAP
jgi:tryptophan 2-monooxygenase